MTKRWAIKFTGVPASITQAMFTEATTLVAKDVHDPSLFPEFELKGGMENDYPTITILVDDSQFSQAIAEATHDMFLMATIVSGQDVEKFDKMFSVGAE